MEFERVRTELKKVNFDALRIDCDNFFEGVVVKNELDSLTGKLNQLFGSPAFPSKDRLTYKAQELVNGLGGIMSGQTLYFWSQQEVTIFAMLWPWKDGQRTTVKIIQK